MRSSTRSKQIKINIHDKKQAYDLCFNNKGKYYTNRQSADRVTAHIFEPALIYLLKHDCEIIECNFSRALL